MNRITWNRINEEYTHSVSLVWFRTENRISNSNDYFGLFTKQRPNDILFVI